MTSQQCASVGTCLTLTMLIDLYAWRPHIIQGHNEIRDLKAEILQAVCTDVEMELLLQEVTGEVLLRGANKAPDTRLDLCAWGFWAKEQSAFFYVRVILPP